MGFGARGRGSRGQRGRGVNDEIVLTLLVAGDDDTPCLEPSLFLKATLPDAALCVLPRAGHLVNLEEPALFNAIVCGFLAAVEHGRWSQWKGRAGDPGASQGEGP